MKAVKERKKCTCEIFKVLCRWNVVDDNNNNHTHRMKAVDEAAEISGLV